MRVVLRTKQAKQDRQPDLAASEARKLNDEHHHHPAVPPPGALPGPLRLRAVVQVVRAPHLLARAAEQRVIDRETDRRARLDEHRDQEVQQPHAQLVGIPAPSGEEVMRAAVMPHASEPASLQHPRHGAVADPPDGSHHQHAERLKRRLRERGREQGQQPGERSGNLKHGGDLSVKATASVSSAPRPDGLDHPPDSGSPPTLLRPLTPRQRRPRQRSHPRLHTLKSPKLE